MAAQRDGVKAPAERAGSLDGQKLAWLIWGRRGEGAHVTEKAISWPAGLSDPADTTTTRGWGTAVLGSGAETPSGPTVQVTPSKTPCLPEGMVSEDEWDFSKANVIETSCGPLMVAGHVCGESLTIVVVMPAVVRIADRTEVMVLVAPMKNVAGGVPSAARAFLLGYEPRRETTTIQMGTPVGAGWGWQSVEPMDEESAPVRAGLSMRGDDAWSFLVAEYSVPFSTVGVKAGETKTLALALAAFVRGLPRHQATEDMLYWPAGHAPATAVDETIICKHPDGWAALRLGGKRVHREEIGVPEIQTQPNIDAKVDEDEWKGAAQFGCDFLGIGHVKLRAGLSGKSLWLAAVCDLPRKGIKDPSLEILLDPSGDGGLLPRPDDVLVLPGDGRPGTICYWQLPKPVAQGEAVTDIGKWIEKRSSIGCREAFAVDGGRVTMEAGLPLEEVGVDMSKLPKKIGMLMRIRYKAEFEVAPGK
jgi:hypothetical protein